MTALVGLVAAAALLTAAPSQAVGKYGDASGDAKGAPDITNVIVAESNGQIVFTIVAAGLQRGADQATLLFLDTDVNPATGNISALGAEYFFILDLQSNSFGFARWTGADWDFDTPSSTVRVITSTVGAIISVNASELGGARAMNFWARSAVGGPESGQFDDAPDEGEFNYTFAAGGPEIKSIRVSAQPASPKAGKPFTISPESVELPFTGSPTTTFPAESYACKARLGAKALQGAGTGGCTVKLPKTSKRKTLIVDVTVEYQGATKTVRYTYKVR